MLEGGIEGRPENVLFYATSNRRHLLSRDMIENEKSTAINPSEATEEKVSLSDRFGLWLGFHNLDQSTYFAIIEGYAKAYGLEIAIERIAGGSGGMVHDPWLTLGARRLAIYPGSGGTLGQKPGLRRFTLQGRQYHCYLGSVFIGRTGGEINATADHSANDHIAEGGSGDVGFVHRTRQSHSPAYDRRC